MNRGISQKRAVVTRSFKMMKSIKIKDIPPYVNQMKVMELQWYRNWLRNMLDRCSKTWAMNLPKTQFLRTNCIATDYFLSHLTLISARISLSVKTLVILDCPYRIRIIHNNNYSSRKIVNWKNMCRFSRWRRAWRWSARHEPPSVWTIKNASRWRKGLLMRWLL